MSRLGLVELAQGGLALLDFQLVELRLEDSHGHFAVLVLAALVLALHDDAGRKVRDADGGFHFVDVLAAMAAGAESVDAHIFGPDDDLDAIVDFRNDENGREGSVPARGLIEGRNADQAMHAAFSGENAVGVLAFDLNRGGFDARFFAGRGIENGGAKTFFLRPAQIHAQEHFGPVLRFGAARAGLDGDDGVKAIVLRRREESWFRARREFVGGVNFLGEISEKRIALRVVRFFLGEIEIGFDIADLGVERAFAALTRSSTCLRCCRSAWAFS